MTKCKKNTDGSLLCLLGELGKGTSSSDTFLFAKFCCVKTLIKILV